MLVDCSGISSHGNQFYVAFLRQFSSTSRIEMIVLTKSTTPVQFNISSSTGYNYTGTTTANAATFVTIPSNLQVRESSYTYRHLGLHVTSSPSQPISVVLVGYTSTPRSTYLALPCHDQPTDEYIYYGISHESSSSNYYSQILLVGCRDNTTVTITPTQTIQLPQDPQQSNSATVTIIAGTSYTVTLHSLQTLLIAVQYTDLSGTKIVSNYPLTVVGGHDCAQVPVNYGDCDPIATQVPPTINWGTNFLLTPLQSRNNGQRFKVIASESNTNFVMRCSNTSLHNIIALSGNLVSYNIGSSHFCYAHCSQPCFITELAFGRYYPGFVGASYGDPLLMTVPPIRQYPQSVTFTTLPEMPTNFYSIAVPADAYFNGTVVINGVLTMLTWTSIYNVHGTISGYGYTTAANGNYTISHSHPNGKIYVSVYGFQIVGGYGYPAGMLLNSLANANDSDSSIYQTNCVITSTVTAHLNVITPTPTTTTHPSISNISTVTITETTPIMTMCTCDIPTSQSYLNTVISRSTVALTHTVTTALTNNITVNNSMSSYDQTTVFVPIMTTIQCPKSADVSPTTTTVATTTEIAIGQCNPIFNVSSLNNAIINTDITKPSVTTCGNFPPTYGSATSYIIGGGTAPVIIIIIAVICIILAVVSYKLGLRRGKRQIYNSNGNIPMIIMNHTNDNNISDMKSPHNNERIKSPTNNECIKLPANNELEDSDYEDMDPSSPPVFVHSQPLGQYNLLEIISLGGMSLDPNDMLPGSTDHSEITPIYQNPSMILNVRDSPYSSLSLNTFEDSSIYDTIGRPLPAIPVSETIETTSSL